MLVSPGPPLSRKIGASGWDERARIRERVRLYDGEMTTGTPAGGGFLLSTRLPLGRQLR
jgi:hypothetical protein